ncbi:MAG: adenylate/guanylate cyclase domain-containing protein [Turneriella sp.]|nr:adenylate/guanylate cyclase domain-containing protein [Turneriella sp.]
MPWILLSSTGKLTAQAKDGVFYYDSENAPTVALQGIWKFSCTDGLPKTLTPGNLEHTIQVPGTWRGYECPQGKLPGTGRHRYHLRIEGKMRPYGLAIFFPAAGTSMVAYWNDHKIHEAGDPAAGKPGFRLATIPIAFSDKNDLVIDVANFDDRYGGLWAAPVIGTIEALRAQRKIRFTYESLLAAFLLFATLFCLGIYVGARKKSYLYLGIFAFFLSLRTLVENERIAHSLLGPDYWYLLVRLAHLGIYFGFIFFYLYIRNIFVLTKKWRWWEIAVLTPVAIYDLLVVTTPPLFFTEFLNIALIFLILMTVLVLYYNAKALLSKQRGAWVVFAGMIVVLAAGINDIFLFFAFRGTIELMQPTICFFIFLNASNLAFLDYRIQRSLSTVEETMKQHLLAIKRMVPPLAEKFAQDNNTQTDALTAREKIPVRFTTLFADLRGFTTLAESFGPEKTFTTINTYLEKVVPAITAEGGQVLEYQGDGILAFFLSGADSCLRAAQSMQDSLQLAMADGSLPPLEMGIAMHTGNGTLTLLGNYRRMEPTLVSLAIFEVQDLESLCGHFKVKYVLTEDFFYQLSRKYQSMCRILTDINDKTIFTIADEHEPKPLRSA